MPEEINRVVTDRLADFLFTPSEDGDQNLKKEGVPEEKIHFVGNVMIDSLVRLLPVASKLPKNGYPDRYALVTLHRPSNVDDSDSLKSILESLLDINRSLDVVFPVHPRTRQRIAQFGYAAGNLHLLDPLPYIEFLALQQRAAVVTTDSGGTHEETTYLGVSCITLRENTERPVTVTMGTNVIVGKDRKKLTEELTKVVAGTGKKGAIPPLWDGKASERIAKFLKMLQV